MLHALRALFLAVCALLGVAIGHEYKEAWLGMGVAVGIGACCVMLELAFARRFIAIISTLMFGIVVGFVVAYFLNTALNLVPGLAAPEAPLNPTPEAQRAFLQESRVVLFRSFGITFVCCFLTVLAILRSKDEFKFVIPFVELKREGGHGRPLLLDTSVIIDGRIADVVETKIVDGQIIVPRFVLNELQTVADSSDPLKRGRGRRGLDLLNQMRKSKASRIEVQDITLDHMEGGVDQKLIRVAKLLNARLVTTDFNLNKVAQVQGVDVINVNDVANALRQNLLPGERLRIRIVKTGEQPGQGVGYLEDGTMVVVEDSSGRIGHDVDAVVTNVRQTSAGRLIFGRPAAEESHVPSPQSTAGR